MNKVSRRGAKQEKKEREKMKVFPPSFLPFLFLRCCRKKIKNEKFTFVNKMKMVRTIRTIQISRPTFQPRLKVQQNGWNWMQSLLWLHIVSNLELVERFEFLSRPITTNGRSCVHVLLLECRMFFKWYNRRLELRPRWFIGKNAGSKWFFFTVGGCLKSFQC